MPVWRIVGGDRLEGALEVQGSKNAVLPILAASLLTGGVTRLRGCPALLDVDASVEILRGLGCGVMQNSGEILIDSAKRPEHHVPHALMERMRSSVMFLGAILARCGEVRLSAPGGCELGARPIDLHLKALEALGAEVSHSGGEVVVRAARLKGTRIRLDFPSVGATENVMLAACAAEGETVLSNAAREPEIVDLQSYLNAAGASIRGAGTPEIVIAGKMPDRPLTEYTVMPDRIVACTLLCAAACAGGEVELRSLVPAHIAIVTDCLREMGCAVRIERDRVLLRAEGRLRACPAVETRPYPGFPTDAQALLMSACLKAEGESVFVENIFENRYRHVPELRRLGADIRVEGRTATVRGVKALTGAELTATDLRGGAAMVLAALGAEGETLVRDSGHVLRGYESLDRSLRALGAEVRMETA